MILPLLMYYEMDHSSCRSVSLHFSVFHCHGVHVLGLTSVYASCLSVKVTLGEIIKAIHER